MKKILLFVLIVSCFIFSGCSEKFDKFMQTPVYPNQNGTYIMYVEGLEESNALPKLQLDMYNKKFVFTYDILSSYLPTGTVNQDGSEIILTTDDGLYKYVFKIVNTYTLQFVQEKSANVSLTDVNFGIPIEDGAYFQIPQVKKEKTQEEEEDNFLYWAY